MINVPPGRPAADAHGSRGRIHVDERTCQPYGILHGGVNVVLAVFNLIPIPLLDGSRAFFKDQRAANVGDLITVLVKITDSADIKNETTATRDSSQGLGLPNFFGLETAIPHMMAGATAAKQAARA